jgi:hypothetical protein
LQAKATWPFIIQKMLRLWVQGPKLEALADCLCSQRATSRQLLVPQQQQQQQTGLALMTASSNCL